MVAIFGSLKRVYCIVFPIWKIVQTSIVPFCFAVGLAYNIGHSSYELEVSKIKIYLECVTYAVRVRV
jgi:hypothetical protein